MFQIKVAEQIKTHTLCSITFFPENRAFFEIKSKNMAEPQRSQMTYIIWRVRVACSISKAKRAHVHAHAHAPEHPHTRALAHTHTHTEKYLILIAFPRQQLLRERAWVMKLEETNENNWCFKFKKKYELNWMCNVCFRMCKMYLFMFISSEIENQRHITGFFFNFILKTILTGPRIKLTSVRFLQNAPEDPLQPTSNS